MERIVKFTCDGCNISAVAKKIHSGKNGWYCNDCYKAKKHI